MSRFFVGQPVRVNCPISDAHGFPTSIVALSVPGFDDGRRYVGHRVALLSEREGELCVFEEHELDPIVDEKNEACDEDFKRDLDRMLDKEEVR